MPAAAPPQQSRLTAELFVVPMAGGHYLVYAPLRRAAFVANAAAVNQIADIREGAVDSIPEELLEFLRELQIVDAPFPEAPPLDVRTGDPRPTTVSLFLTTGCNLRCTYCYAAAGDTPLRSMSLETACRGIDFVARNAEQTDQRAFEVVYHGGGEPTTNWRVLCESYGYAERIADSRGLAVTGATATNGVLNDQQIEWIIEHLDQASVSFDGLPKEHDRHRLTIAGKGSSERVMHTLRQFDAARFTYGLRVTVTHQQIAALPESIAFICGQFNPRTIQVEPAFAMGRWSGEPSAETHDFVEAFRAARRRAAEFGRDLTYSAARIDTLTTHFCGVSRDSFCLTPDGNVSGCYEAFSEDNRFADVFLYGRPSDEPAGFTFSLPVLEGLREQSVEHREYCCGCFAKWHCAGDCYHKSLDVNGRGEFRGTERCHITRELTLDQILDRIAESGGLVWRGG